MGAQVWAGKSRAAYAKTALLIDPHSPGVARATLPQCNMEPWYAAFGVKIGDKQYLSPEDRVEIWYQRGNMSPHTQSRFRSFIIGFLTCTFGGMFLAVGCLAWRKRRQALDARDIELETQ